MNSISTTNITEDNKAKKRAYWANHIKQWNTSGQTQSEYCRRHQLKLHQLVYWKQVFSNTPKPKVKKPVNTLSGGFVAMQLTPATEPPAPDLTLQLPNGLRIEGVHASNLAVIQEIIRWHP